MITSQEISPQDQLLIKQEISNSLLEILEVAAEDIIPVMDRRSNREKN